MQCLQANKTGKQFVKHGLPPQISIRLVLIQTLEGDLDIFATATHASVLSVCHCDFVVLTSRYF